MVDLVASLNHTAIQHPWLTVIAGFFIGYFPVQRQGGNFAVASGLLTAAAMGIWLWRNS